jgi:phosphatidylserine/phosphatidylglycerophosphate/cardiolipin synthase-like enzyme
LVEVGVDVRVMMPSAGGSDNPMVQHAGHRNFEKLLRCGVRLLEYPHTLLHQKVMTIDGVWSAVGSSNFDDRSFETNDEITLGIRDPATAQRLDAVFEKYVPHCKEIELEGVAQAWAMAQTERQRFLHAKRNSLTDHLAATSPAAALMSRLVLVARALSHFVGIGTRLSTCRSSQRAMSCAISKLFFSSIII